MKGKSKKKGGIITGIVVCVIVLAVSVFLTVWGIQTSSRIKDQNDQITALKQTLDQEQQNIADVSQRIEELKTNTGTGDLVLPEASDNQESSAPIQTPAEEATNKDDSAKESASGSASEEETETTTGEVGSEIADTENGE